MNKAIAVIGFDLAKSIFQVHGIDEEGIVLRRKLSRAKVLDFFAKLEPCQVGTPSTDAPLPDS